MKFPRVKFKKYISILCSLAFLEYFGDHMRLVLTSHTIHDGSSDLINFTSTSSNPNESAMKHILLFTPFWQTEDWNIGFGNKPFTKVNNLLVLVICHSLL